MFRGAKQLFLKHVFFGIKNFRGAWVIYGNSLGLRDFRRAPTPVYSSWCDLHQPENPSRRLPPATRHSATFNGHPTTSTIIRERDRETTARGTTRNRQIRSSLVSPSISHGCRGLKHSVDGHGEIKRMLIASYERGGSRWNKAAARSKKRKPPELGGCAGENFSGCSGR